mmetsp:Transcript_16680/g.36128  ORF Transcript_16680/g.36128 Transcript_16680/m.36128 type:complete len:234 (-) Transcript_16680:417-1118(-)
MNTNKNRDNQQTTLPSRPTPFAAALATLPLPAKDDVARAYIHLQSTTAKNCIDALEGFALDGNGHCFLVMCHDKTIHPSPFGVIAFGLDPILPDGDNANHRLRNKILCWAEGICSNALPPTLLFWAEWLIAGNPIPKIDPGAFDDTAASVIDPTHPITLPSRAATKPTPTPAVTVCSLQKKANSKFKKDATSDAIQESKNTTPLQKYPSRSLFTFQRRWRAPSYGNHTIPSLP